MIDQQISDDELREVWRSNGGDFHGPNVETGTMEEAKLLPMLRNIVSRARTAEESERIALHNSESLRNALYGSGKNHGLDTDERVCFYEQEFYVFSNFSSFRLYYGRIDFVTSEQAYQYQKFSNAEFVREMILKARSAHDAYKIADDYKYMRRHDWDEVKLDVMRDILRHKLAQHEYVGRKLRETGDREMVENSWRDPYWGWGEKRDGKNMLGRLWMELRDELRCVNTRDAKNAA